MRGHVAHSCQGLHISLPDNGLTFPYAGRTGYSPFESEPTVLMVSQEDCPERKKGDYN